MNQLNHVSPLRLFQVNLGFLGAIATLLRSSLVLPLQPLLIFLGWYLTVGSYAYLLHRPSGDPHRMLLLEERPSLLLLPFIVCTFLYAFLMDRYDHHMAVTMFLGSVLLWISWVRRCRPRLHLFHP